MSVIIKSVDTGSPACKAGIKGGCTLLSINDNILEYY